LPSAIPICRPSADEARIETAGGASQTAQALYDQATDQVMRARRRHRRATRQGGAADPPATVNQEKNITPIQKLTVARVIGLASGQEFEFTDKSPYQPFEGITVE